MIGRNKRQYYLCTVAIFCGLPLLLWALGDFPRRGFLKEFLSLVTLLAFSLALGLVFFTRCYRSVMPTLEMGVTIKLHKLVGYVAVGVLLIHPLLLVFPRHFEAGVEPREALGAILMAWDNPGVVLGIIAWCLMLVLGVTSLLRKQLPLKYKTWRAIHGALAVLVIVLATCHVVLLGRYANLAVSSYVIVLATSGVLFVLRTNLRKTSKIKRSA